MLNRNRLPEQVCKPFEPFLKQCTEVFGDNLKSVAIYGSSTGVNYVSGVSDINSIFLFQQLNVDTLAKALPFMRKALSKKIAVPLMIGLEEAGASLDVFPIEFLDIKENHVLVFGEDVISSWNIHTEHLRLLCEQQIKGKLLRIRQAYLEIGQNSKGLEFLLKDSLGAFIPVFRNVIRLKGGVPPMDKPAVIKEAGTLLGFDAEVFLAVYRDKTNDEKIGKQAVAEFIKRYITEVERIAQKVDQF